MFHQGVADSMHLSVGGTQILRLGPVESRFSSWSVKTVVADLSWS